MAFDGVVLCKVIDELKVLEQGKVNKIFEPNKNEILIAIYAGGKNYALNIDVSANNYRINLTTNEKPNPFAAPNFCMLLRKYLIGGRITRIYMKGLERIAYIEFECFNEMNDKVIRTLAIELMGKYSNVVFLSQDGIIIDALRKFDTNLLDSERCIMPARKYIEPKTNKQDLTSMLKKEFVQIALNQGVHTLDSLIPSTFVGISKLFIQSCLEVLKLSNTVCTSSLEQIYDYIQNILGSDCAICKDFKNNYTLFVSPNKESLQINFFLDDFYFSKSQQELFKTYKNNLLKVINGTLNKMIKKFDNINEKIKSCDDMETLKIYGELLIANIYKVDTLKIDENFVELENYNDNNTLVKIPVNNEISTSQNAENYFKKYNKCKNTLLIVNVQKEECAEDLSYLEDLTKRIEDSDDIDSVTDIYNEISENLLFNDNLHNKKPDNKVVSSLENYLKLTVDDYTVLVGKNNKQNDYLTTKVANENDYWFHTKEIHGSHVILRSNGNTPKMETIVKCAEIAAYHSKAKFSSHVPVDYTLVKYVKKPNGAAPGYVIYTNNKTVFVDPSNQP